MEYAIVMETYIKVDCKILAITEKAFLIDFEDKEHWIPRSVCMNGHKEFHRGEEVLLYIAEWKAKEFTE